jgi:hypothetical protein
MLSAKCDILSAWRIIADIDIDAIRTRVNLHAILADIDTDTTTTNVDVHVDLAAIFAILRSGLRRLLAWNCRHRRLVRGGGGYSFRAAWQRDSQNHHHDEVANFRDCHLVLLILGTC